MNKQRIMALLLALSVVWLAGCTLQPDGDPVDPVTTTTTTAPTTAQTTDTVDTAASLDRLRQSAADASRAVAVAYLGVTDTPDTVDTLTWLQERNAPLIQQYPFLIATSADHIIGTHTGELYAIVPADPEASVSVTGAVMAEDDVRYTQKLYQSDDGAPILIWCNNAGYEPSVQVTIHSAAQEVTLYPQLNDLMMVDGQDSLLDVTPYAHQLATDYAARKQAGWRLPTLADLQGTTWHWDGYLKTGGFVSTTFTFNEWTVDVEWRDGIDDEPHVYPDAAYEFTVDGDYAVLEIDFREMAGKLRYNLLINDDISMLYTVVDVSDGSVDSSYERLYRALCYQSVPVDV